MNNQLLLLKRKYRDRNFLLASILESAGPFPGEFKTRILMKTEMNYSQIRKYFNFLRENGMLKQDLESKRWFRTPKGETFLDMYNKMRDGVKEL